MSKAVISNQWNLCSILTRPVTIILLFYDCVDLLCEWDFGDVFYGFFLWKWRRNFNFTEQQNITDPFHPWDFFLIINYFQTTPMPFLLLMAGALNWSQNAMPLLQLSSYKWHNKFIFKIFQFDIVYESF